MRVSNEPLVTIGVPTYNRPKTLKRAIDSLVNQTYKNIEIIVSDNCSTDKAVQTVMSEFASDLRVKFIVQPVNKGAIYNFNFLLTFATGDYFMWLGDDDWLDLNYVESCISFLLKHPDYTAAYGTPKMYTPRGEYLWFDANINLEHSSGSERVKYYYQHVINNGCFSALVPIGFKTEMVLNNLIAIDWLIVARLTMYGKYKMLESTNCHISGGGASATTEGLTGNFSMPPFTRSFPYLTIALNAARDILHGSCAYLKVGLVGRLTLAVACFSIIFKRHKIKEELRPGLRKYLSYKKGNIKMIAKRILKRNSVSI